MGKIHNKENKVTKHNFDKKVINNRVKMNTSTKEILKKFIQQPIIDTNLIRINKKFKRLENKFENLLEALKNIQTSNNRRSLMQSTESVTTIGMDEKPNVLLRAIKNEDVLLSPLGPLTLTSTNETNAAGLKPNALTKEEIDLSKDEWMKNHFGEISFDEETNNMKQIEILEKVNNNSANRNHKRKRYDHSFFSNDNNDPNKSPHIAKRRKTKIESTIDINFDEDIITDSEEEYTKTEKQLLQKARKQKTSENFNSNNKIHGLRDNNKQEQKDNQHAKQCDIKRMKKDDDMLNNKVQNNTTRALYPSNFKYTDDPSASKKDVINADINNTKEIKPEIKKSAENRNITTKYVEQKNREDPKTISNKKLKLEEPSPNDYPNPEVSQQDQNELSKFHIKCKEECKINSKTKEKLNSNVSQCIEWTIVDYIKKTNNVDKHITNNIIQFVEEDNNIPFIAGYRKNITEMENYIKIHINSINISKKDQESDKENIQLTNNHNNILIKHWHPTIKIKNYRNFKKKKRNIITNKDIFKRPGKKRKINKTNTKKDISELQNIINEISIKTYTSMNTSNFRKRKDEFKQNSEKCILMIQHLPQSIPRSEEIRNPVEYNHTKGKSLRMEIIEKITRLENKFKKTFEPLKKVRFSNDRHNLVQPTKSMITFGTNKKSNVLPKALRNGDAISSRYGSLNSTNTDKINANRMKPNMCIRRGIRLPRGGWIVNPFDELKFKGKKDDINPMRFLNEFNKIASYENIEDSNLLYYFEKCLKEQAAIWFETHEFQHINEAKIEFIKCFWGELQQARFREMLYIGKYKPNDTTRMSDYALNLARQAKLLNPPMRDVEIIRCLKRHFNNDVVREIKISQIRNVPQLISFLEEIQDNVETYTKKETKEEIIENCNQKYMFQKQNRKQNAGFQKQGYNNWNTMNYQTFYKRNINTSPWHNNIKRFKINNKRISTINKENITKNKEQLPSIDESEEDEYTKDEQEKINKSVNKENKNTSQTEKDEESYNNEIEENEQFENEQEETNKSVNEKNENTDEIEENEFFKNKLKELTELDNEENDDNTDINENNNEKINLQEKILKPNEKDKYLSIVRTNEIIQEADEINDKSQDKKYADPKVKIKIGKIIISTLIDTGAEISVMSRNTLHQIIKAEESYDKIPIRKCKLRGAFGEQELTIPYKVQLLLSIKDTKLLHEFYVVDHLAYPMVLGHDALSKYKATIEYIDNRFEISFRNIENPEERAKILEESKIEGGDDNVNHLPIDTHKNKNSAKEDKSKTKSDLEGGNSKKNLDYQKDSTNISTIKTEKQKISPNIKNEEISKTTEKGEIEGGDRLQQILNKHQKLFQKGIGRVNHYVHKIEMIDDKPYKRKPYPIPETHKEKVKQLINEWTEQKIIEKAATQYVNPLVAVVKKSGDLRICLDARMINMKMVADYAQPPTIDEIFNKIGNRKYFSTLDVTQAFWQIPLHKESKKYTGFMFNNQTYVFKRMPFGLKTAGASFTRAMNKALKDDMLNFVIVYLDDILIASNTLNEHLEHIDTILQKLEDVGFRLNRDKCEFLKKQIKFLGHTFDQISASINDETKYSIECFQKPKNKKDIQSFLGLVNWDRRFVKNLARLTRPLEDLLKKDAKFSWNDREQEAFNRVKQEFRDAPTLYLIKPKMKYGIDVDASKTGLGARLYQFDDKEPEKKFTIAYASRSLKNAEKNYTITEIECLALIFALKKWHIILMGRKVKINTDHRAIQFVSSCANASERIARWMSFMQEFDLEINHIPGSQNQIADTLSRQFANDTNRSSILNEYKICQILERENRENPEKWVEMIKSAQDDAEHKKIYENDPNIKFRDQLFRIGEKSEERIIIPNNISWELLESIHKYIIHFGTDKTIAFAKRFFKIENIDRIARDVVASCSLCIASKYYTKPTCGPQFYDLPNDINKTISIDIFGPLPKARRNYKYVLVIMDQFSKFIKCYPMTNQKIDTIIDILENKYLSETLKPEVIVSDNGGQFLTEKWSNFANEKGIDVRRTSPYNPQSNPVERVMRELGRVIRAYFHDKHTQWDKILQRFENTINHTEHFSTGQAPVDLYPQMTFDLQIDQRLQPEDPEEIDRDQQREKVKQYLAKKAVIRRIQADKHETAKEYKNGDKIWIKLHRRSDANRKTTRKIHLVYQGPYRIREVIRRNAYLIEDLNGTIIGTYNSRQIRPHREPILKTPQSQNNENDQQSSNTNNSDLDEEIRQINILSKVPITHITEEIGIKTNKPENKSSEITIESNTKGQIENNDILISKILELPIEENNNLSNENNITIKYKIRNNMVKRNNKISTQIDQTFKETRKFEDPKSKNELNNNKNSNPSNKKLIKNQSNEQIFSKFNDTWKNLLPVTSILKRSINNTDSIIKTNNAHEITIQQLRLDTRNNSHQKLKSKKKNVREGKTKLIAPETNKSANTNNKTNNFDKKKKERTQPTNIYNKIPNRSIKTVNMLKINPTSDNKQRKQNNILSDKSNNKSITKRINNYDNEPLVNAKIGKLKIKALIDTGAEISIIAKKTFNRITKARETYVNIPTTEHKIRGAINQEEITSSRKIQISIKINKSTILHDFHIVEELAYQMIIGNDALKKHEACIDYKNNKFKIRFQRKYTSIVLNKKKNTQISNNYKCCKIYRTQENNAQIIQNRNNLINSITQTIYQIEKQKLELRIINKFTLPRIKMIQNISKRKKIIKKLKEKIKYVNKITTKKQSQSNTSNSVLNLIVNKKKLTKKPLIEIKSVNQTKDIKVNINNINKCSKNPIRQTHAEKTVNTNRKQILKSNNRRKVNKKLIGSTIVELNEINAIANRGKKRIENSTQPNVSGGDNEISPKQKPTSVHVSRLEASVRELSISYDAMEKHLKNLEDKEANLYHTLQTLMVTKAKTMQSIKRKTIRIEKLERIKQKLNDIPTTIYNSDGEEKITDLIYKLESVNESTTSFAEKIIICDNSDDKIVKINTSINTNNNINELSNNTENNNCNQETNQNYEDSQRTINKKQLQIKLIPMETKNQPTKNKRKPLHEETAFNKKDDKIHRIESKQQKRYKSNSTKHSIKKLTVITEPSSGFQSSPREDDPHKVASSSHDEEGGMRPTALSHPKEEPAAEENDMTLRMNASLQPIEEPQSDKQY